MEAKKSKRQRKSESAKGGSAYARAKGLKGVVVLLTDEQKLKARQAAGIVGKSLSAWCADLIEHGADEQIREFKERK